MRCLISALLLGLAGCASHPADIAPPLPRQSPLCEQYVAAWVGYFKANVAKLDGAGRAASNAELIRSREALVQAGTDEQSCVRPLCIIQPQAGGRLHSYCGYRVASGAAEQLYRWVPWTPQHR